MCPLARLCLSWLSTANYFVSYAVMNMFLSFSTQWNSIGRRNRRWRHRLKGAWISLQTFTLLVFRTKLTRRLTLTKSIQLMEGSDFPSTSQKYKLGPTYPRLAIFYRHSNSFTRTAFRELSLHQKSPRLKQFLGSNMIPLRTKFDTQMTVISHEERAMFFLCRSSFSEWVQRSPT